MKDKYVSFDWWWGGWNNIRMCYEMIGAISYISGRKIILPPKGYCSFLSEQRHTGARLSLLYTGA
jgi:hypothetical protein